ncbi:nidogen-1-like [Hydra vulgaris]|uniref:Nidogen-1-like n=1 Tax=Hydra vulgaris TaxID=6087 RepID=A0ABM4BX99_HYDVU
MHYIEQKMRFLRFFVLRLFNFLLQLYGIYTAVVWYSSFETNASDLWNITPNNQPFQRVLYSNLNGIPAQDGLWAMSADKTNNQLLLPQMTYYGGNIDFSFYAYSNQSSSYLAVQFLNLNLSLVQNRNTSIIDSVWTQYYVTLNSNQYQGSSAFLVSLMYSGESSMYIDSIAIAIDGKIISCPTITSSNHCGFDTAGFGSSGWSFTNTAVNWVTSPGFTYLKRDFTYLGGLLTGSMNFRGLKVGAKVIIEISVDQTSYKQEISSGFTNFDLTANNQYTVGQTYTILITFVTTTVASQLNSISIYVVGNCSKCHSSLTCNKLPNGVNCVCNQNSCPGSHTQCIVSKTDQSSNPCSCQPGFIKDISGNCFDINECNSLIPPCSWSNGVCTNINGSYLCTCMSGWIMGQDNASCIDVDECNSKLSLCSWKNGLCQNTNGSYFCSCINGWKLSKSGSSCVDIDECDPCNQKSPCSPKMPCFLEKPCSWNNGACVNTVGSFSCICNNGWILDKNGASCVKI